jgi:hypothetical protein
MSKTKSDINLGIVFTMIIASSLFLLVVMVGAHAFILYTERDEVAAKWEESRYAPLADLLADQKARLNGPAKAATPTTKPASISIDQAMKLVVQNKGNIVFPAGK